MLTELSNEMADAVASAAPSVVQVIGRHRPASGLVYADNIVVTMIGVVGFENGTHVRQADGAIFDAELAGADPTTGVAVLRVPGFSGTPIAVSKTPPRVGHLALGVARSWSNVITASAGVVSIIGGPLHVANRFRRGRIRGLFRRHAPIVRGTIDEIIRTTAPMHDGFAGGAFLDAAGGLIGIPTAASIRGLGVVIPAPIAWKAAAALLEHGGIKRGYLGIAGQPVTLPENQQGSRESNNALLVVGVTKESPAAQAGLLVGDVLLALDDHAVESPDDLLDLLGGDRIGTPVALHLLRGGKETSVTLTVGERSTGD
jgi:S1-C subfamily serine protease